MFVRASSQMPDERRLEAGDRRPIEVLNHAYAPMMLAMKGASSTNAISFRRINSAEAASPEAGLIFRSPASGLRTPFGSVEFFLSDGNQSGKHG